MINLSNADKIKLAKNKRQFGNAYGDATQKRESLRGRWGRLKPIPSKLQEKDNKAVYTTAPVAGGWAGAVMSWAGAEMIWAGA